MWNRRVLHIPAHQTVSSEACSRVVPQSAESWLFSPSSSRWCEVWAHPLPGIRTTPLLPKSLSDHQGTWWSWACLRERDSKIKARKRKRGESREEKITSIRWIALTEKHLQENYRDYRSHFICSSSCSNNMLFQKLSRACSHTQSNPMPVKTVKLHLH